MVKHVSHSTIMSTYKGVLAQIQSIQVRHLRIDPTRFQRPVRPLSREEKLKQQEQQQTQSQDEVTSVSSEAQPSQSSSDDAYFAMYQPLSESRLKLDSEHSNTDMASSRVTKKAAKKEKEMKLKKGFGRRLSTQTSVSQSLALAMHQGTLPTFFNKAPSTSSSTKPTKTQQQTPSTQPSFFLQGEELDESDSDIGTYNDYYEIETPSGTVNDLGFSLHVEDSPPQHSDGGIGSSQHFPVAPEVSFPSPVVSSLTLNEDIDMPAQWYPGHMKAAMDELGNKMKDISIAIEVRDARLPFSTNNPMLNTLIKNKVRIIVFNKCDLVDDADQTYKRVCQELGIDADAIRIHDELTYNKLSHEFMPDEADKTDRSARKKSSFQTKAEKFERAKRVFTATDPLTEDFITEVLRREPSVHTLPSSILSCPHVISSDRRTAVIFTKGRDITTVKALLTLIKAVTPPKKFKAVPSAVVICGYPNVGKSTIINALKQAATLNGIKSNNWGPWSNSNSGLYTQSNTIKAKVGPNPGVTRRVDGFKVSEKPPIVILDTPGIMIPRFDRTPAGIITSYKLALVGCISDRIADMNTQSEYLLRFLNKSKQLKYLRVFGIPASVPYVAHLDVLLYYICKAERFIDPNAQQYRDNIMETRFGRALHGAEYMARVIKCRQKEIDLDVNLGIGANIARKKFDIEYAKRLNHNGGDGVVAIDTNATSQKSKKNKIELSTHYPPTLDLNSEEYLYPSREEMGYALTTELMERANSFLLKQFRAGLLGKVSLESLQ